MTETRNTIASTGPATRFDDLTDALLTDGTYTVRGDAVQTDGFIVAVAGQGIALEPGATYRDIDTWVQRFAVPYVTAHPAPFYHRHAIGSWVDADTGILYLDVVEIFPREEREAAIAAARHRNEIAIWDAGQGREIRV